MSALLLGWGPGPWGATPWGSGVAVFGLSSAVAVRENVIRLTFTDVPRWTGTLELTDASNPERYAVVAVPGTSGFDGEAVRTVAPVRTDRVLVAGSGGKQLDLWVDRPMTHWPAQYRVSVNNLVSSTTGFFVSPTIASAVVDGLRLGTLPQSVAMAIGVRDLACPQTRSGLLDPLPDTTDSDLLGTYPADAQGDLAFDEGIESYRKRVIRRCMTRKGAFAHLPLYGVGVPAQVKRLATPSVRETLAAEAESQIRLEPETLTVQCTFVRDVSSPGLWWLKVQAKTVAGQLNESVAFNAFEG